MANYNQNNQNVETQYNVGRDMVVHTDKSTSKPDLLKVPNRCPYCKQRQTLMDFEDLSYRQRLGLSMGENATYIARPGKGFQMGERFFSIRRKISTQILLY